jgi:hypothetical protein
VPGTTPARFGKTCAPRKIRREEEEEQEEEQEEQEEQEQEQDSLIQFW